MRLFAPIAAGLILAAPASAGSSVQLTRAVFHETAKPGTGAKTVNPASELRRGDTVILVVRWTNAEPASAFTVSSAIPEKLSYQASSRDAQVVSVDGGKSWGLLNQLTIRNQGTTRRATPEDVTHLRWRISRREAATGSGQLTYSAIVR